MNKIWKVLDESIAAAPAIEGGGRARTLWPSEASARPKDVTFGKCQRAAYLRFKTTHNIPVKLHTGEEVVPDKEDYTAKTLWVFAAGNLFEDMIIKRAILAGVYAQGHVKFRIPVTDDIAVSGEVDCVFKDPKKNLIGIEIKSVHGHMAEKFVIGTAAMRAKGLKGKPKDAHLMQSAIYADHYKDQMDCFYLLYIMRGKCFRTEFKIEVKKVRGKRLIYVDGKKWPYYNLDDVFERFEELAKCIEEDILPPREFDLVFDDEKMKDLLKKKDIGRTDAATWQKYFDRIEKHEAGEKVRLLKRPKDKGNWECSYCDFVKICYDKNNKPHTWPGEDDD